MVGNDIVDLAEAEKSSNWKRPRFLDKIFTPKEQQFIYNSENPFYSVWQLWSMKEAAYKLYTQLHPSRFYNPKSFECSILNGNQKVSYNDFECFTQSKITSKYIISEARLMSSDMSSEVVELKESNPKIKSITTTSALIKSISEKFEISKKDLKLKKSEFGIPTVYFNTQKISVSLSHHGNFGAYAFVRSVIPDQAEIYT